MSFVSRFLFAISLMSCAHFVFAADYYWSIGGGTSFSSPKQACDAWTSGRQVSYPDSTGQALYRNDAYFLCLLSDSSGQPVQEINVNRYGDSCPVDHVYNNQVGECEPPPPDCTNLGPGIFKGANGPVINSNGSNYVVSRSPGSVCLNRCSYESNERPASCYFVKGSTQQGFCNYVGTANGESCSAPDGELGAPGDSLNPPTTPDVPPSDPNDPGCPPGYGWSGTTCAKNPDDGNPPGNGDGDGNGGDGGNNGGGDGDGGNDGGGGDGGSGGGGDGGGNGSGGDGDGNGGGGSGGGGDGNGDGEGDGEEEGGTCEKGACGGLKEGEQGTFSDTIAEYEKLIDETKADIRSYKGRFQQLADNAITTNLSGGGGLPSWSFTAMGSSYSISFTEYSGELSVLRQALLFIIAVICLFIIFGGSKESN